MIAALLGGVGLFLLGMSLLTDGLKQLAGEGLRRMLRRFTGSPFKALLTGMGLTAMVQSSSATTLMTIGFVSAGLLTFPQAIGVVFGANIGTTSTSWLVAVVGLKFSMSQVALPLVGVGALMKLLSRGWGMPLGLALAGFGLVFVGIDALQAAMADVAETFDVSRWSANGWLGRLLLVGVGIAMTVVMQSSSAAAATTLAALHGGAVDLGQAAALVVGQNVGTTVNAAIAAIGASVPAKRTAVAHIAFNLWTGAVAFLLLPLFVSLVLWLTDVVGEPDSTTTLALFHTVFNVLGVAMVLPWVHTFAAIIERVVPEKEPSWTRSLDRSTTHLPAVAMEAALSTLRSILDRQVHWVRGALSAEGGPGADELARAGEALAEVRRYVGKVHVYGEDEGLTRAYEAVLHAMDHQDRLLRALQRYGVPGPGEASVRPAGALLRQITDEAEASRLGGSGLQAALAQAAELRTMREDVRARVLRDAAASHLPPDQALKAVDDLRQIDRLAWHIVRSWYHLCHHDRPAGQPEPAPEEAAGVYSEAFQE
jgi:phosphate:Na+ symporter